MHHKTSDSVEIQENEFPENARKKKLEKSFFLFSQNRTNTDEFGRNPKNKTPLFFLHYEFLRGRIRTSFFSDFPRISENWEQKNNGRILGIFNFSPPLV